MSVNHTFWHSFTYTCQTYSRQKYIFCLLFVSQKPVKTLKVIQKLRILCKWACFSSAAHVHKWLLSSVYNGFNAVWQLLSLKSCFILLNCGCRTAICGDKRQVVTQKIFRTDRTMQPTLWTSDMWMQGHRAILNRIKTLQLWISQMWYLNVHLRYN